MKPTVLTGDRPTGPLHIGHYVGSLKTRVALQETHNQYLIIADGQALTDNFEQPEKVRDNVTQVALDYLAVGLNPDKSTFFIQSLIPELTELTFYFLNLVTLARAQRNPTVKDEAKQKQFDDSIPLGFLIYPVSQAADILAFDADLVPIGEDQKPMIEQTNEIARRFNSIYHVSCFKEARPLIGSVGRLPGIDGKQKMSKSLGNAILLSDPADEIRRKVNLMYTDPSHLKVTDPGKVEGNVVFDFLDYFDPMKAELEELKEHYQRGGLGDSVLKRRLTEILDHLISPMRKRRQEFEADQAQIMQILKEGSLRARAVAESKLSQVKEAMRLIY